MQLKLEFRDGKLKYVVLEMEDKPKKSSYVETLQNILIALGYLPAGSADGKFGKDVEAAVKKFQKENGLKETGRVDPETAGVLDAKVDALIERTTQKKEIEDHVPAEAEGKDDKKDDKKEDKKAGEKDKKGQKKAGK